MASFVEEGKTSSHSLLKEIQTEHMIYQINSAEEKMKKCVEEITKAMENARNTAHEEKIVVDELKIKLYEKEDKMKKLNQDLIHARKHVELITKKTTGLETEVNKIKDVIDRIKENTQDLNSEYLEKSQNELMNSLVKMTSETEKAHSDLSAAKKIETMASNKLNSIEIDFHKLEEQIVDKIKETEREISNIGTTIEHIVKSHNEITSVSKELLKSAIPTKIGFGKEDNYKVEQGQLSQGFNDNKIAIQNTDISIQ